MFPSIQYVHILFIEKNFGKWADRLSDLTSQQTHIFIFTQHSHEHTQPGISERFLRFANHLLSRKTQYMKLKIKL